ncbi:MAG: DUF5107 domain-containing protein, partial [Candidatus Hydrogenedentes bacterium]|nr:DUF5107 domain-containing protein [Candidatus Hydrogenedentota bacterium]
MKSHCSRLVLVLTLAGALSLGQAAPGQSSAERVKVWQDTLVLPTYAWIDDDNPVFPEFESHIYYPYSRQDRITAEKQDRTYRTLCLENEFLRVTCIPEL